MDISAQRMPYYQAKQLICEHKRVRDESQYDYTINDIML